MAEDRFHLEIVNYEKENHMPPYISSIEQKGIEQGRVKELVRSISDYLRVKFPESSDELVAKVSVIKDYEKLTEIQRQLWQVDSLEDLSID